MLASTAEMEVPSACAAGGSHSYGVAMLTCALWAPDAGSDCLPLVLSRTHGMPPSNRVEVLIHPWGVELASIVCGCSSATQAGSFDQHGGLEAHHMPA